MRAKQVCLCFYLRSHRIAVERNQSTSIIRYFAGVELLTKVASREYSKNGIRVNTVVPGMISTPMTAAVPEKVKAKFLTQIPLGRFGTPEGTFHFN